MVKRKFDSMVDLDPRVRGFLEGNRYVRHLFLWEGEMRGSGLSARG